jgi:hypothetical protein
MPGFLLGMDVHTKQIGVALLYIEFFEFQRVFNNNLLMHFAAAIMKLTLMQVQFNCIDFGPQNRPNGVRPL